MTIDEAIRHCEEVAEHYDRVEDSHADDELKQECIQCAADHRQLAEWLTELKELREENKVLTSECDRLIKEKGALLKQHEQIAEYKRLLKATINDIYKECSCNTCGCDICEHNRETCDYDDRFTWIHKATVLKLIGETNDEP